MASMRLSAIDCLREVKVDNTKTSEAALKKAVQTYIHNEDLQDEQYMQFAKALLSDCPVPHAVFQKADGRLVMALAEKVEVIERREKSDTEQSEEGKTEGNTGDSKIRQLEVATKIYELSWYFTDNRDVKKSVQDRENMIKIEKKMILLDPVVAQELFARHLRQTKLTLVPTVREEFAEKAKLIEDNTLDWMKYLFYTKVLENTNVPKNRIFHWFCSLFGVKSVKDLNYYKQAAMQARAFEYQMIYAELSGIEPGDDYSLKCYLLSTLGELSPDQLKAFRDDPKAVIDANYAHVLEKAKEYCIQHGIKMEESWSNSEFRAVIIKVSDENRELFLKKLP